MTNYFFYNTDADSVVAAPRPRCQVLIVQGIAATGGPRRFGEQLGQLPPGDTLVMDENRVGIAAVGRVLEYWDGRSHEEMLYNKHGEDSEDGLHREREYRIKVDRRRLARAIGVQEVRERLGYAPRVLPLLFRYGDIRQSWLQ